MQTLDVFSARDLRNRSGELLKDAQEGRLSVLTKHGHPAALAIPFDVRLLELGLHRHLAVSLFSQQLLTLAEAAKLADLPIETFLKVLAVAGVDAVAYPAAELEEEIGSLR